MKMRNGFVTNSSSSSFILSINFNLKNGKTVEFHGNGGTGETGRIDYFDSNAYVTVSPKELGTAKDVEEMIQRLTDGVVDDGWEEQVKIFEKSNPVKDDCFGEEHDAYDFIKEIRDNIHSMDDIDNIVIEGNEYNYMEYLRKFEYDCVTKEYSGIVEGYDFEKDGSSGGDLNFDISDCEVEYLGQDEEDF